MKIMEDIPKVINVTVDLLHALQVSDKIVLPANRVPLGYPINELPGQQ